MSSSESQEGSKLRSKSVIINLETDADGNPYIDGKPVLPAKRITLADYFDKTTAHGLSDWYHSESWIAKVVWLLLLLTMIVFLIYGVVSSIIQFYHNPVITSISVNVEIPKDFPDVYICPSQPINIDAYIRANRTTKATIHSIMDLDHELMKAIFPNQISPMANLTNSTSFDLRQFSALISTIVHQPETLLPWISFTNHVIDPAALSISIIAEIGICYHIPSPGFQLLHGVALRMLVKQPAFKGDSLGSGFPYQFFDGVTIGIVPAGKDALVFNNEWTAPCATFAKLRLTQKNTKLINQGSAHKHPRKCRSADTVQDFKFINSSIYTRKACVIDCFFPIMMTNFGCVPAVQPSLVRSEYSSGYQVCKLNDLYTKNVQKLKANPMVVQRAQECILHCHQACLLTEYDGVLTLQGFQVPDTVGSVFPAGRLPNQHGSLLDTKNRNQSMNMMIDIAFSSLDVTEISESPSITPSSFLSNIGGHFGLWIGASLMTIAQFIVFCCGGLLQISRDCAHNGVGSARVAAA